MVLQSEHEKFVLCVKVFLKLFCEQLKICKIPEFKDPQKNLVLNSMGWFVENGSVMTKEVVLSIRFRPLKI